MLEGVIRPNVKSHLSKLDSIKKNNSIYNVFDAGGYDYNDTESLIQVINKVFKQSDISLVKHNKIGAHTDNTGKITISITDNFYDEFTNNYYDVRVFIKTMLNHELIHREQLKKVNWSTYKHKQSFDNKKEYYRNDHEVMAYARTIIDELTNKLYSTDKVLDFLQRPKSDISSYFDEYMSVFSKDNKTIKRLYKYMYEYLVNEI